VTFLSLLSFATGPVGRWVLGGVAISAVLVGIYMKGVHHATDEYTQRTLAETVDAQRKAAEAGVLFDSDGVRSRLRDGRF